MVSRCTEQGDLGFPKLDSKIAVHSDVSPIEIVESRLEFGSGDAWLLSIPELNFCIAGIQWNTPTEVKMTTNRGQRRFEGITMGLIVWNGDDIKVTSIPRYRDS